MSQMGIQPEKERKGEGERERFNTGGARFQETSSRSWSEKLAHPVLFVKAFYTFFLYIEINGYYKIIQCQQP